jgi:hypothetical protein
MTPGSGNGVEGVQFPSEDGRRSSQRTARSIFSAAVRSVDAEAAEQIERIDKWRKDYLHVVRDLVERGARSAKDAGRIASDGLEAIRSRFVFEQGNEAVSLTEVFETKPRRRLETAVVKGEEKPLREVTVPYGNDLLRGDALKKQLDRWVSSGTIESSCARAVETVIDDPDRLDLSDQTFAILGAGSEMGPFPWLCRWGARIHAIDIPNPEIWNRILRDARDGSGTVSIPVDGNASGDRDVAARAGIDLIQELPEAHAWLHEQDKPFTLGDYAYADGTLFARLAVAIDTLTEELLDSGTAKSYAYLASPTDVFAVTPEVIAAARSSRGGLGSRAMNALTARRLYAPSYSQTVRGEDGEEWGIFDCLILQQGANYSLAKSLQRWRAVATQENELLVSANVAPATRTRSVVKNKVLAAAYAGAGPFGVEIFRPDTSRALMAAMLVHDVRNRPPRTRHPYELFVSGAAHGGLWRMPYEPRSVLPLAVVLGYTTHRTR